MEDKEESFYAAAFGGKHTKETTSKSLLSSNFGKTTHYYLVAPMVKHIYDQQCVENYARSMNIETIEAQY